MNRNFAGRFEKVSRHGQAKSLHASSAEELLAVPSEDSRVRRQHIQKLALLAVSIVTLFSLAGMIITRAMQIASL